MDLYIYTYLSYHITSYRSYMLLACLNYVHNTQRISYKLSNQTEFIYLIFPLAFYKIVRMKYINKKHIQFDHSVYMKLFVHRVHRINIIQASNMFHFKVYTNNTRTHYVYFFFPKMFSLLLFSIGMCVCV
jgi:hypothetical protein